MADSTRADIDARYSDWRKNPDLPSSIGLCNALRGTDRRELVDEVGPFTMQKHGNSVAALVAAGRMYMECARLPEAQAAMMAAGKVAPYAGTIYRWLGEILLRKGDCLRAEKILERAITLGADGDDVRTLLDRARSVRPIATSADREEGRFVDEMLAKLDDLAPTGPRPAAGRLPTPAVLRAISRPEVGLRGAENLETLGQAATRDPSYRVQTGEVTEDVHGRQTRVAPESERLTVAAVDESSRPTMAVADPLAPWSDRGDEAPPPPAPRGGPSRPPPPLPPALAAPNPISGAPDIQVPEPAKMPAAGDVLDALATAGVFEPDQLAARPPSWDRPQAGPTRRTSVVVLGILVTLLVGGGAGTFFYVKDQRVKAHAEVEALLAKVDAELRSGDPKQVAATEPSLSRAFQLESRSKHAALSWLRERVTLGLVKGGADVAIEEATVRAKSVGATDKETAFAQVASFLFQGDMVGAVQVISRLDGVAADDATFQLVSGAVLERAGDPRAPGRYEAALRLDPALAPAELALVRVTALEGDPKRAVDLARAARAKYPDRPEGVVLVALAWARDSPRGDAPPEVAQAAALEDLPVSLRAVPSAIRAVRAIDARDPARAAAELRSGFGAVDSPAMATWLGAIAIDTGDEELARRAALAAVSFSAGYAPARLLASRVALLGGRLDEALLATKELDPTLPDAAIVRAAVAYERLDLDEAQRAVDGLPAEAKRMPLFAGILAIPAALRGQGKERIAALAVDEGPWSDLVAMDLSLDTGDLETAGRIAEKWKTSPRHGLEKSRLARLARYEKKNPDADRLSAEALEEGAVTPREVAERVMVLAWIDKPDQIAGLLARYPTALGPLTRWFAAYGLVFAGKVEEARGRIASADPPAASAPLVGRVVAAATLSALQDRRSAAYVKALLKDDLMSPDVVAAAEGLGLVKGKKKR